MLERFLQTNLVVASFVESVNVRRDKYNFIMLKCVLTTTPWWTCSYMFAITFPFCPFNKLIL